MLEDSVIWRIFSHLPKIKIEDISVEIGPHFLIESFANSKSFILSYEQTPRIGNSLKSSHVVPIHTFLGLSHQTNDVLFFSCCGEFYSLLNSYLIWFSHRIRVSVESSTSHQPWQHNGRRDKKIHRDYTEPLKFSIKTLSKTLKFSIKV